MEIRKKDGRIQEFDENKIFTSLDNASRDIEGVILNESDLKILVTDIIKTIKEIRKDGTPTSSYEVIGIIIDTLKNDEFNEVVKSFVEFEKI